MNLINDLNNINELLTPYITEDEYTSIGYVPILNSIIPSDIITIKKAQKLLDIVIIQNISKEPLDEFSINTLQQLNPNIVIDYIETQESSMHISCSIEKIETMNLFKGILAILPSSVFICKENFEVFKGINIFCSNFKELFSLHDVSTPSNLKSFDELEIISILQFLEKSKEQISKDLLFARLSAYNLYNYQEFYINNNLYINFKAKYNNNNLNISYCFNLK